MTRPKQKVMYIFVRETKTKTKSQNPDKNNTGLNN